VGWARPSELYRALECPASTVLPRIPDEEGPAATWGKEVHSWKETGIAPTPRVDKWLKEIPDYEGIRGEFWPAGQHEMRLWMAEDGKCDLELGSERPHKDWAKATQGAMIRGIADHLALGPVWHLTDLKTGRFPPDEPPSQIPQLLIYADMWLDVCRKEPGILLSIDHWHRYPKGQPPVRYGPDYLTKAEVQHWHHTRLIPARRLALKPEAKLDQRPGPWCQYCKSALYCAAVGGVLA
jgi:hypothetical protein